MINLVDITCGIIIIILSVWGLRVGFLSTFLSVIMVYLAAYFAAAAAGFAKGGAGFLGEGSGLLYTILFLFIFLVTYAMGEVAIWILKKIISVQLMGILDSIAALVLGAFKALLVLGIIFELIGIFPLSAEVKKMLDDSFVKRTSIRVYKEVQKIGAGAGVGIGKDKVKEDKEEKKKEIMIPKVPDAVIDAVTKEASKTLKRFAP
ncbi:hypothetical protein A2276_08190 [candidate division WOR-1 bacterium RIFOXYA12_FULL_43_27]|uniref:Colicin V production protein n=1 Tax=candidate division WOR-1 bacterium RIFOXYC2_FULL_46_14 TaxID=1802587 RepID=A0A1F4U619_UNCSA|nr:MAG: hypothetical protein A2276_08190 [candidate division WOR-1 bacterium RIFOXYA12_FULL_43_27]OGC20574.1 MAG: hypothetical protein A2292_06015 [candidate division WOR-1 bacterium RIFOXYB2_FULL_46_45]OGC31689.1 MAG: hypothetical protein A2232_05435 [candidate division WOR-1 bacterium RIFOXYA2_FULL_46_56]OGC40415.1 MAG: hypothetical protein A2438_04045 [candidate division WOR-1 bacterium RIFOXYC2_FULL_46_14]